MTHPVKLVLLYGGKSGEHEISLVSAASVLAHLNAEKYEIIPIAMDKKGQYHLHYYDDLLSFKERLPVTTDKSKPLQSLVVNGKLFMAADVVFPVVHGPLYEDGCLQGLLKLAEVPFVGCDVLASAVAMDKDMARRIACQNGLKCAPYKMFSSTNTSQSRQQFIAEAIEELGWPVFIKPCSLGSSVGIHKVHNLQQFAEAMDDALRYDESVVVEQFINGREIELAVLEQPGQAPAVSIAGEIRVHHPDGFYSYSAKYLESSKTELIIPASMDKDMLSRLQQAAADVFTRLKCNGMARVDFFIDEKANEIYFNEINTLPGFTSISMYPKLWQASGKTYPQLLDDLIELAMARYHYRQHLVTDYL